MSLHLGLQWTFVHSFSCCLMNVIITKVIENKCMLNIQYFNPAHINIILLIADLGLLL